MDYPFKMNSEKKFNCLILSAGKGTRMGPLGASLPKPLWPLFETTLLEIQISRALSFGAEKILINLFHAKEEVKAFLKKKNLSKKVQCIEESELLDVGGAIYNLKNQGVEGDLLIMNCDQ